MCEEDGIICTANVVDHKKPHKGDLELFFDSTNLQSLCEVHHNGAKTRQEFRGLIIGVDVSGMPIDPKHHWYG